MFDVSLKEGDTVPFVVFKLRVRNITDERPPEEQAKGMCTTSDLYNWKNFSTDDLFKGKRCVLFALPGAFTPTCSSQHLPDMRKIMN